jgi:hypothetical protein
LNSLCIGTDNRPPQQGLASYISLLLSPKNAVGKITFANDSYKTIKYADNNEKCGSANAMDDIAGGRLWRRR